MVPRRWKVMPWLVVAVVGPAVTALAMSPPPTIHPVPAAVASRTAGPHTVVLPTGDRLAVSTGAAGQTLASPAGAAPGPYVTEQLGGHHYVFPAAAAADRGARSGGRSRYDVSPAVTRPEP